MTATTRYGVRLTLPGAPDTDHDIPGLHIPVRTGTVTPLPTDDDVARARELADAGAHIEVVELDQQLSGKALSDRAAELNIEGRSAMTADELRAAIAVAENAQAGGEES